MQSPFSQKVTVAQPVSVTDIEDLPSPFLLSGHQYKATDGLILNDRKGGEQIPIQLASITVEQDDPTLFSTIVCSKFLLHSISRFDMTLDSNLLQSFQNMDMQYEQFIINTASIFKTPIALHKALCQKDLTLAMAGYISVREALPNVDSMSTSQVLDWLCIRKSIPRDKVPSKYFVLARFISTTHFANIQSYEVILTSACLAITFIALTKMVSSGRLQWNAMQTYYRARAQEAQLIRDKIIEISDKTTNLQDSVQNLVLPVSNALNSVSGAAETVQNLAQPVGATLASLSGAADTIVTNANSVGHASDIISSTVHDSLGPFAALFNALPSKDTSGQTFALIKLCSCFYMCTRIEDNVVRGFMVATSLADVPSLCSLVVTALQTSAKLFSQFFKTLSLAGQARAQANDPTNVVSQAFASVVGIMGNFFGKPTHNANKAAMDTLSSALRLVRDSSSMCSYIFKFVATAFGEVYYAITGSALRVPGMDDKVASAIDWMTRTRQLVVLSTDARLSMIRDPEKGQLLIDLEKEGSALAAKLIEKNVTSSNFNEFFTTLHLLRTYTHFAKATLVNHKLRKRPLFVVLRGDPGNGKSLIAGYLEKDIQSLLHKRHPNLVAPWKQRDTYVKNLGNKDRLRFDDGYVGQTRTRLDDYGTSTIEEDIMCVNDWIIHAVNDEIYSLNMADLSQKGVTYFTSAIVILSTNQKQWMKPKCMTSIEAIISRVDMDITVNLKEQYKALNGQRGVNNRANADPRANWHLTVNGTSVGYQKVVLDCVKAYEKHLLGNPATVPLDLEPDVVPMFSDYAKAQSGKEEAVDGIINMTMDDDSSTNEWADREDDDYAHWGQEYRDEDYSDNGVESSGSHSPASIRRHVRAALDLPDEPTDDHPVSTPMPRKLVDIVLPTEENLQPTEIRPTKASDNHMAMVYTQGLLTGMLDDADMENFREVMIPVANPTISLFKQRHPDMVDAKGLPQDPQAWADLYFRSDFTTAEVNHSLKAAGYLSQSIPVYHHHFDVNTMSAVDDHEDCSLHDHNMRWNTPITDVAWLQLQLEKDPNALVRNLDKSYFNLAFTKYLNKLKGGAQLNQDFFNEFKLLVSEAYHVPLCDKVYSDIRVPFVWFAVLPKIKAVISSWPYALKSRMAVVTNSASVAYAHLCITMVQAAIVIPSAAAIMSNIFNSNAGRVVVGMTKDIVVITAASLIYVWAFIKMLKYAFPPAEAKKPQSKIIEHRANVPSAAPGVHTVTKVQTAMAQSGRDAAAAAIIINKVEPNMYTIGVTPPNSTVTELGVMTFVKDRWAICTKHQLLAAVTDHGHKVRIFNNLRTFDFNFDELVVYLNNEIDLAYIKFPKQVPQHSDITTHFIEDTGVPTDFVGSVCLVRRTNKGQIDKLVAPSAQVDAIAYHSDTHSYEIPSGFLLPNFHNEPGYSGALYVNYNTQSTKKIVGMHVAGMAQAAMGQFVTRQMLDILDELLIGETQSSKQMDPIREMMDDSLPQTIFLNNLDYMGRLKPEFAHKAGRDSKIIKSPIFGELCQPEAIPANLRVQPDGSDSLQAALKKLDTERYNVSNEDEMFVSEVMEALVETLRHNFSPRILTWHEAINGCKEIGLEPITVKTSPGWPDSKLFKAGKKRGGSYHMFAGEPGNYTLVPEAMDQLLALEKSFFDDSYAYPAYTLNLKDELRTKPVPRMIFASSKLFTILQRKYFGSFIANFMSNAVTSFSAVGVNAHSVQWHTLFKKICPDAQYVPFPGDISNNDNTMPYEFINCANFEILRFYKCEDCKTLEAMRKMLRSNINNLRIIEDHVFYCLGRNASGCLFTTVINTFVVPSLLVAALIRAHEEKGAGPILSIRDFIRHAIKMIAYGDDTCPGVLQHYISPLPRVIHHFKLISGMTLTHASKQDVVSADDWVSATFLKRSFVKDENGYYHGALPTQIIENIPNFINKDLPVDKATEQCCQAALLEAFHHGRLYYEDLRLRIRAALDKHKIKHDFVMYSYQEMMSKYLSGSLSVTAILENPIVHMLKPQLLPGETARAQSGKEEVVITSEAALTSFADDAPAIEVCDEIPSSLYDNTDPWNVDSVIGVLGRPATKTIAWNSTDVPGTLLHRDLMPTDIINSNVFVSRVLNGFKFVRADIEIELRINTNLYNSGALLVAWCPVKSQLDATGVYATPDGPTQLILLSRLMNHDHVVLSASKQKVLKFVMPYNRQAYFSEVDQIQLQPFGVVEYVVFNQLNNSEGYATTLSVTITSRMTNIVVSGPKAVAQSSKEQSSVSKSGILTTGLKMVNKVTPILAALPNIGALVAATAPALKQLERVASSRGWDKPTMVNLTEKMIESNSDNDMLGTGADVTEKLAVSPYNVVSDSQGVLGPAKLVTSINQVKLRPGLIYKTSFLPSDYTPGQYITSLPICPSYCPVVLRSHVNDNGSIQHNNYNVNNQLSMLTTMYKYWTGGMKYAIHVGCASTVTGKIRVVWVPYAANSTNSALDQGAANNITATFDFSGDTIFCFQIPFNRETDWLLNVPADSARINPGTVKRDDAFLANVNGFFSISLASEVSYPGPTNQNKIDINIFSSGAEDLRFARPCDLYAGYWYTANTDMSFSYVPTGRNIAYAQSAQVDTVDFNCLFENTFDSIQPGSKSRLASNLEMGEEEMEINSLLHRYQMYGAIRCPVYAVPATDYFPTADPPPNIAVSDPQVIDFVGNCTAPACYRDSATAMARSFLFNKGSIRFKLRSPFNTNVLVGVGVTAPFSGSALQNTGQANGQTNDVNWHRPINIPQIVAFNSSTTMVPGNISGPNVYFDFTHRNCAEFEAPFYSSVPFNVVNVQNLGRPLQTMASLPYVFRADTKYSNADFIVFVSYGDDNCRGHYNIPDLSVTTETGPAPPVEQTVLVEDAGIAPATPNTKSRVYL